MKSVFEKNKRLIAIVIIALLGALYLNSTGLSLLPGAEGVKVGVYSVQDPHTGASYVLGRDNPSGAGAWVPNPMNLRYDPDDPKWWLPDLYVDLQNPWTEDERKQSINYWVKGNDGKYHHIYGYVQSFYFNIVFRAEASGDAYAPPYGQYRGQTEFENRWNDGEIWFATGATVWNVATQDPDFKGTGHVWAAPLYARVDHVEYPRAKDEGDFTGETSQYIWLTPEPYAGRQVTLFSSPGYGSIIDIIGNTDPDTTRLNETLAYNWGGVSPDTRMRQTGYFVFEPTDFGCESWYDPPWAFHAKAAKIQYTIKIYYLIIGDFIYTHDEYEEWVMGGAKHTDPQGSGWPDWIDALASALGNPWTWLGIGTWGLLAVAIVTGVVLIYFFGMPKWRRKG